MTDDPFERAVERLEAADEQERWERRARRERIQQHAKSGRRQGFQIHATVFIAVQLFLVVIWAISGAGYPWFVYPLFGWGIGLAAHYVAARE
ncbi:MAG TPA: 2TM domain-containing protein [Mycobacteriales bacterium]|nr:2TM domain-containing protein [Mycobacteriales bacterium]